MIHRVIGSPTCPVVSDDVRIIVHCVNNCGCWDSSIAGEISCRWKDPESSFNKKFRYARHRCQLGEVLWTFVELDISVATLIAENGVRDAINRDPLDLSYFEMCLNKFVEGCRALIGNNTSLSKNKVTIHIADPSETYAQADTMINLIDEVLWDLDVYIYSSP